MGIQYSVFAHETFIQNDMHKQILGILAPLALPQACRGFYPFTNLSLQVLLKRTSVISPDFEPSANDR